MLGPPERAVLSYTPVDLTELMPELDVLLSLTLTKELRLPFTRHVREEWQAPK